MKRSANFLLREVAGKQIVVPLGAAAAQFQGMLTLNATGVYLWQLLEQEQTEETLVQNVCNRYEVDTQVARKDITAFIKNLRAVGALEE